MVTLKAEYRSCLGDNKQRINQVSFRGGFPRFQHLPHKRILRRYRDAFTRVWAVRSHGDDSTAIRLRCVDSTWSFNGYRLPAKTQMLN